MITLTRHITTILERVQRQGQAAIASGVSPCREDGGMTTRLASDGVDGASLTFISQNRAQFLSSVYNTVSSLLTMGQQLCPIPCYQCVSLQR
jgi:hypothetical protein